MDLEQIKDLMRAMGKRGISRMTIKNGDFELELEKPSSRPSFIVSSEEMHPSSLEARALNKGSGMLHLPSPDSSATGKSITSPMVGTFYSSPSPEDPSFVKVGDQVKEDTVVCIVEAMKVMNEVKAGVSGVVTKMLVENGHPVEFGTKLFLVE